MFTYVLKRLLIFIPTLIIISVATFAISKMTPGDPVKLALGNSQSQGESGSSADKVATEKAYLAQAEQMGLNDPVFYFSFTNVATPDTLYRYLNRLERSTLERLIDQYGNWPQIETYYRSVRKIEFALLAVKQDSTTYDAGRTIKENTSKLYYAYKDFPITSNLDEMLVASGKSPNLAGVRDEIVATKKAYENVKAQATKSKTLIPNLIWYGTNNQYHKWVSKFIVLDFGKSYKDKREVWSKIKDALPWTLLLNAISIFLSYLLAIPLGVFSARKKDTVIDKISTVILFVFYSLPSFWIATLLITFLTTDEYGMNFFPTFGLGDYKDMDGIQKFNEIFVHIILPVYCLTYGSLAYLSRQMRGGILSVFRQDYIRTARAKGVPENKIVWKHAFRNSLIPIITIFASLFPAAISGAFIIENIFSIPGMGKVAFEALLSQDYPVVFTVMMFSAFLTLVGTLVSDIMYAFVDPRISYK